MKYDPLNEKTTVIVGDALEKLRELESESVHCCVTSPPYFGLRDYGMPGQVGLEETPDAYVAKMVEIFREVRRVLRGDGTLWLNLGDSYAGGGPGNNTGLAVAAERCDGVHKEKSGPRGKSQSRDSGGLAPKQLLGIPWRVAFALQADGWYLRQDIIWHKPNPMPESVKDRCTKAHEYVFMFSKSARYFYDAEAVAETAETVPVLRDKAGEGYQADYVNGDRFSPGARVYGKEGTRNRRSVWTIATQPYAEAHFATMAPQLATDCIKAGSPANGVILDPFGGAGTTAFCATLLGRSAVLIELNPEYEKLIRKRLKIGKTEIVAPIQDAGIFEGFL